MMSYDRGTKVIFVLAILYFPFNYLAFPDSNNIDGSKLRSDLSALSESVVRCKSGLGSKGLVTVNDGNMRALTLINSWETQRGIILASQAKKDMQLGLWGQHKYGYLSIEAIPNGCKVYIDDLPYEQSGDTCLVMTAGKHHVVIKKYGYADYSDNVTIEADRTQSISCKLSKK